MIRASLLQGLTLAASLVLGFGAARAQTPLTAAFTYQGELADGGAPVSGSFDIRFRLYDAAAGGNQVGGTLCSDNQAVSNGRFMTSLDFGAAFDGQRRYLEIEVRSDSGLDCSDGTGFTVLLPRQELTAGPNATFAQHAATASTATTALTANNASSFDGQSPSFYQSAENLVGTLADARLSSNVARLNGNQTFTGVLNFTNAGNTFVGNGAGLTSLNGANIVPGTVTRAALNTDVQGGLGTVAPDLALASSVGTGAGAPYSICVSGSVAYVVCQSLGSLRSYDIGNSPAAPVQLGVITIGGNPNFVALSGSLAYVLNDVTNTLTVFNVSNPAAISQTRSVATGISPSSVVVSAPYAYVVNRGSNTLQVFDISNPLAMTLEGSIGTEEGPRSVAVAGSLAYVVNEVSNTLQVFNISNPAAPTLLGGVPTGNTPNSIAISGSYAYVVNRGSNTLQVFDISDSAAPTQVGIASTGINPFSVTVSGAHAYVVNRTSNTLQVFSITNPSAPTLAGSVPTGSGPVAVALSGSFAYVANRASSSLQVFNAPLRVGYSMPLAASSLTGVNGAGLTDLSATNITTGVLANARTTGTSVNTPSTLVLRDASGNFTAGTVTAALSGTASNASNLNNQPASFYTSASNITTGNLSVERLPFGGTWPLSNVLNISFGALVVDPFNVRVGIGTLSPDQRLSVSGNASKTGGGSWASFSDARLKHDVAPLEGTLDKVLQLRGVSFYYNDPQSINELGGQRIGMIAQEVERVFPDWVEMTPRGYKSLTFRGFEALTVEALRELRAEKDAQIAERDARIEELSRRLARLEALLSERAEK